MTTIFISYSREDEPFAKRLYQDLTRRGFQVWWDRVSMPSRALTFFHEIREAITYHDRLILVVGPRAVTSDYVEAEWRYALEIGKVITPVLRSGGYDLLPEELQLFDAPDFRDDTLYTERFEKLVRQVSELIAPMGQLMGIPSLPPHIIKRIDLLLELKESLLADLRRPVVVTGTAARIGVHGMGGIGKSVLAALLAHDHQVRRAFPDGIFWITMGQQPGLLERQRLVAQSMEAAAFFDTIPQGRANLGELLASRAVLLILDDLWEVSDAAAFDVLGKRCRMLITTRDSSLVTALGGMQHQVQLLSKADALLLLAQWTSYTVAELPPIAHELVIECGFLPLALSITGALVRDGIPWTDVLQSLREADLKFLNHPLGSVIKSIKVGIDALTHDQQKRFAELIVFPANESISEVPILTLWAHTGQMKENHARQLLMLFKSRAIVQMDTARHGGEGVENRFSLHDLLRDYATQLNASAKELHNFLLGAYAKQCQGGWHGGPNDGYFFQHLRHHLLGAEQGDELEKLLLDLKWLSAKNAYGLTFDLLLDIAEGQRVVRGNHFRQDVLLLLEGALRSDIHFIARHRHDYPQALHQCLWNSLALNPGFMQADTLQQNGKTKSLNYARRRAFLQLFAHQAYEQPSTDSKDTEWLYSLIPPPLDSTYSDVNLTGHRATVTHLSFSIDGQRVISLASGIGDLMVWDSNTGAQLLSSHFDNEYSGAISAGGKSVLTVTRSKLEDVYSSLRIRSTQDMELLAEHLIPTDLHIIDGCGYSEDGNLLACGHVYSPDVSLLDTATGELLWHIPGVGEFPNIAVSDDGRFLAIGYLKTKTICFFDVQSQVLLHRVFAPKASYIVISRDSRLFAGGGNRMVRVWSTKTGEEISTFQHEKLFGVSVISFSPSSRFLATGTDYGQVFVWNLETFQLVYFRELHNSGVKSLAFSPDEHRLVSAGYGPVIVSNWQEDQLDNQSEVSGLGDNHHAGDISRLLLMQEEGLFITSSWDGSVRTWNMQNGLSELVYTNDGSFIFDMCLTAGNRIVYVTAPSAAIAVDIESGEELSNFYSPEDYVTCVACSPDDRWLAFSTQISTGELGGFIHNRIHIYNLQTDARYFVFTGHKGEIQTLTFSPDGMYLASGCREGSVAVWQVENAQELADQHILKIIHSDTEEDDVNFGLQLAMFHELGGGIIKLCFSPMGDTIVVQTQDVWLLDWRAKKKHKYYEGITYLPNFFAEPPLEDLIIVPNRNLMETKVLSTDSKVIRWIPILLDHVELDLQRRVVAGAFNRFAYFFKICSVEERADMIAAAIAEMAEALYQEINERQQMVARRLFMFMVNVTGDTDAWQSIARQVLNEEEWQIAVLFSNENCGLLTMTTDDNYRAETVEVSYKLLISSWKRLCSWIEEDRDFLRWRQLQLAFYLDRWEQSGKNKKKYLLSGLALNQAKEWANKKSTCLNKLEAKYVSLSSEAARQKQMIQVIYLIGIAALLILLFVISNI